MSRAYGAVKFEDGEVMFYKYNGTADVCHSTLRKTVFEVRHNWRQPDKEEKHIEIKCEKDEPVIIHTTYGGEFSWNGRACKTCMEITDGFEPFEGSSVTNDELSWTKGIYKVA